MTEHDDADLIQRIHADVQRLRIPAVVPAVAMARGRMRRHVAWVRSALVVAVLAAAVIVPIKVLSGLRNERGGPAVSGGGSTWPAVVIGDPRDAYLDKGYPGDTGPRHVLASGTVGGAEFSFMGWTSNAKEMQHIRRAPCIEIAGPANPVLSSGLGGWCVSPSAAETADGWPLFPTHAEILMRSEVAGGGGVCRNCVASQRERPPVEMGFVTERVARLEVVLQDGSVHLVPVLDWPNPWHFKSFVFFPPSSYEVGQLLAYDADGQLLAQAALCGPDTGTNDCDMSPTDQIAPMPSP